MMGDAIATLKSPRFIFLVSVVLGFYQLTVAIFIHHETSGLPYPFLYLSWLGANFAGIYYIENYSEMYEKLAGYFVLYAFFFASFVDFFI